jgi:hypothetical protein
LEFVNGESLPKLHGNSLDPFCNHCESPGTANNLNTQEKCRGSGYTWHLASCGEVAGSVPNADDGVCAALTLGIEYFQPRQSGGTGSCCGSTVYTAPCENVPDFCVRGCERFAYCLVPGMADANCDTAPDYCTTECTKYAQCIIAYGLPVPSG